MRLESLAIRFKDTRTVCHYLKDLDYDVILCGKSHVNPRSAFPWTIEMHSKKPAGDPKMYTKPATPLDQLEAYFAGGSPNNQRPFCVMVTSYYPHGEHPKQTTLTEDSVAITRFQEDSPRTRASEAQFNQAVKNSDEEFERALALLDKYDLADNTVVIYASDHGRFGKWSVYDRGLSVPFVVRWPGVVEPGTRSDALVSFADVLPTMMEIAGAKPDSDFDGKSLQSLLKGQTDSHHQYVYSVMTNQAIINAHVFPGRMIRSKQYKYTRNYNAMEVVQRKEKAGEALTAFLRMGAEQHPNVPEEELFDMIKDPHEQNNLAADPAYREIKSELKQKLQQWLVTQNDFLKDEGSMPFLATHKHFRLDLLNHPKNKVTLPRELKNSLNGYDFYQHRNESRQKESNRGRE
ncbi:Arylsulfatase [Rubripirellula obstinata]|uniref:Arylsulfatase n=1 Tax=Rubripirellula obstinata TaxID=406547 RepID=A0A5B1CIH2_9BACT|nr:sulfatase/phosphatase domain-containing protein [Rubripirellula obstinata]KAA1259074.1 Arylsulfatase [Rubripirellula obstinata]